MTKAELIEKLKKLSEMRDSEQAHIDADKLLLDFIGDPEIKDAFDDIPKWYA